MSLLRDRRAQFDEADVRVYGVSRDSPWTHIAWSQVLDLNFPLLSDWDGEAVDAFGVSHQHTNGMRGVARRSAFLVDETRTVRAAWRYDTDDVPDVDALAAAARSLAA